MLNTGFSDPKMLLEFMKLGVYSLVDYGASMLPKSRTRPVVQAWLQPRLDHYEKAAAIVVKDSTLVRQMESALSVGTARFFAQSAAALIDSVGQALTQETPAQAVARILEDTVFGVCHLTSGAVRLVVSPSEIPHENMVRATELGWSALVFWRAGDAVGTGINKFQMPTTMPSVVLADGGVATASTSTAGTIPNILGPLLMASDSGKTGSTRDLEIELSALDRNVGGPPTEPGSHIFGPWKVRLEALHDKLISFLGMKDGEAIIVEIGPGPQDRMLKTIAPKSWRYMMVEPEGYSANFVERAVTRFGLDDKAIILGPESWNSSIKALTGGGADLVYSAHPFPPDSRNWMGMGSMPRNPARIMNALGEGVREGGFLVIQTEVYAYAASALETAALGWEPVLVKRIGEPFMPSVHFSRDGYLIVLRRMPQTP